VAVDAVAVDNDANIYLAGYGFNLRISPAATVAAVAGFVILVLLHYFAMLSMGRERLGRKYYCHWRASKLNFQQYRLITLVVNRHGGAAVLLAARFDFDRYFQHGFPTPEHSLVAV
jgi:hypothetical protein